MKALGASASYPACLLGRETDPARSGAGAAACVGKARTEHASSQNKREEVCSRAWRGLSSLP